MTDPNSAAAERSPNFEEFWPFYVGEHRRPLCRALHYLGTGLAVLLILYSTLSLNPAWIPAILGVGYGPAWVAHFFVEHNKPASFTYPGWSLRADFKMAGMALRGKMALEVTRLYGSPAPPAEAPLLAAR